jgi:hypothetical protein
MTAPDWTALAGIAGVLIAGAALVVAIRANVNSARSATAARDSADEAKRANQIAEEANTRAARAHQIALTPSHIDWEATWIAESSVLTIQNTGTDNAHDVVLAIDALDLQVPRRTDPPRALVEPTDRVGINLRSWEQEADRRSDEGTGFVPNVGFAVRVTLTWRSELGAGDKRVWENFRC